MSKENHILKKLSAWRIIVPIGIGIAVLMLFWRDFQRIDLSYIKWNMRSIWWFTLALACVVIRHLAYTVRLHLLSNSYFSFKKAFELIFLWEFSTAVLPSSSGGVAASLFFFNKEGLEIGKGIYIMLVNIVLNTIFYAIFLPLFIIIANPINVHPDFGLMLHEGKLSALFSGLIFYYVLMLIYGSLIAYGVFFNAYSIKNLLMKVVQLPLINRFSFLAEKLGNDIVTAFQERKNQDKTELVKIFFISVCAWLSRFSIIICLYKAFDPQSLSFVQGIGFYAKQMLLYMMSLVSPTPGASGVAEAGFKFLFNEITPQISIILLFLWRLLTYYLYLFTGVFYLNNWVKKHFS